MTVENYVPGEPRITMTETAREQARRELARQNAGGLRLAVKPSGCSGYMYELDYVDEPESADRRFDIDDQVTVFVDENSLAIVQGTEIDYVTEGVNRFFRFRNPNAQGECGGGESFTVNG